MREGPIFGKHADGNLAKEEKGTIFCCQGTREPARWTTLIQRLRCFVNIHNPTYNLRQGLTKSQRDTTDKHKCVLYSPSEYSKLKSLGRARASELLGRRIGLVGSRSEQILT